MTEDEARVAFCSIFDELGVTSGDRVMLGIDMGNLPLPAYPAPFTREGFREREARWCAFVLEMLLQRLGPDGTLLVPAYTYSCGEPGSIFVSESTPSENGPFTEYARRQASTCRSQHPIFSLAGIGRDASAILQHAGHSAFGARSPFARFAEYEIRFLCLGVGLRNSITYIHHLEQSYGCPHRYHKAFATQVIADGKTIPGPWFAYVAFRGLGYRSDIASLEHGLTAQGLLRNAAWEGRTNQLADVRDVDRVGYELLAADSCAFVNRALTFTFDEHSNERALGAQSSTLSVTATERDRA